MSEQLIHLDAQPVEVRDLEKRIISGRIIPYGETIMVRGKPESFTQGALAGIDVKHVKLFDHHERAVGKAQTLEERSDGAYAEFYVSKTARGNDLLELANDGALSFSPGFLPGSQTREGVHTRLKSMPEVSLVSLPAYQGAQVLAVREKEDLVSDTVTAFNVTPAPEAEKLEASVDLSPLERRMESIEEGLTKLETSVSAPAPQIQKYNLSPLRWFHAQVQETVNRNSEFVEKLEADFRSALPEILETRALDDVTGYYPQAIPSIDASGLVLEEFIGSQLVNVLDTRRPLFRNQGSFPMPKSGAARIPIITQHTEVALRTVQKSEIASRPLIVDSALHEAQWIAGGVDVALELIRTADLSVLDLIWNDLVGQFAIVSETVITDVWDAAVTATPGFVFTGAVLGTASYAAFVTSVVNAALTVRTNTGAPATNLFVTSAQWALLLAMVDADGRRILATDGPSNADASAGFNAEAFTLPGGIVVTHVPGIARAYLSNGEAYRVADGGVERVEAVNVAQMGVDIGLLGRVMLVPRIDNGVVVFGISA